jgi:hypothetical protein
MANVVYLTDVSLPDAQNVLQILTAILRSTAANEITTPMYVGEAVSGRNAWTILIVWVLGSTVIRAI